jgi:cytoskeletal protein CcmA (bactofilin family)
LVVAAIIAADKYLNSQKPAPEASITSQQLSEEALRQLAKTDTSVGSNSQTLTIQGNAIINGQTLARGNLNVAGNVQTGGSLQAPSLTISGNVNLGTTQISGLQVAQNLAVQGTTTLRNLNVSGTSTFNGPMTVSQLTVTSLTLSSNATFNIPGHIRFTGASPSRSINASVLGNGGSASIDGSDTSGTVNINSGTNPTAGCFITLTFAQRFTNKPHVLISPVNKAAGQLDYYVTRDNNGFSVCTANVATARQSFAFDYFITN